MAAIHPIDLLKTMNIREIHKRYGITATAIRIYYGVEWVIHLETRRHPTVPTVWVPTYLPSAFDDFNSYKENPKYLILIDKFEDDEVEVKEEEEEEEEEEKCHPGPLLGAKEEPIYQDIRQSKA